MTVQLKPAGSFIEEVQEFSKLSDQERAVLQTLKPLLVETADALAEAFYANLLSFEGTAKHFAAHPERIEGLKKHLKAWYIGLSNGSYNDQYAQDRYRIGYRHVEINLELRYMVAAMSFCRDFVMPTVQQKLGNSAEGAQAILALNKVMDLDLNLMLKTYVEKNQELMAEAEQKSLQKFLSVTNMSAELYQSLLRSADFD
jgi:heme-based aerotactic transducer